MTRDPAASSGPPPLPIKAINYKSLVVLDARKSGPSSLDSVKSGSRSAIPDSDFYTKDTISGITHYTEVWRLISGSDSECAASAGSRFE